MNVFRALQGFEEISFGQGLLGAFSPKPTRLLALHLPNLRGALRSHHLTADPPTRSTIGRDASGSFQTGFLKEYPPAMSRALAMSFVQQFQGFSFCDKAPLDADFLSRCRDMNVQHFTKQIGPDFAA